jgi:glycosyltransferase involved in cell wall biosynthesis
MQTISACMIVQNVEKTLAIALESLGNVCDELIIVDGGSTDKTCEIAANYGARIIRSPWSGNHSQQRNVYLREIKTDWVFVIDSDEFIDLKTKDFLQFVQQQGNSLDSDNFWLPRKWISPFSLGYYISGPPHTPDFQCRLFKYNKDISYVGQIHELIHGFKSSGQGKQELSIYHLDLFINSEEKRRAKVRRYMKNNPLDGALHYYLPPLNSLHLTEWDAQSLIYPVQNLLERLKSSNIESSPLNKIIVPEIKNDEFYTAIQQIAREEDIQTVLEIGSSSGGGSTEAFVAGLRENPNQPTLFCMEVSKPRFAQLQNRYSDCGFVKCYNLSSVSLEQFTEENEVVKFYSTKHTDLNYYTLDTVLTWLHQDREYVKNSGVSGDGIKTIKKQNNIDFFDAVLIDGSEFTGSAEFEEVYGAKIIILDDINTLKNYSNYHKLIADPNYVLVDHNPSLRHGYAIFKINPTINNTIDRISEEISQELPIHFVTIVLNGEPFIRYHIEAFKQLPFKWHWHIVEGVAHLKHDTAWSLQLGGSVTDQIHNQGRSIDGTSEYIDKIARIYPENVTVYRKPEGVFWDGKREMVNEPLIASIHEECLLWQVDADELWTVEQICNARQMFLDNPEKTAAFYWCWYFLGENLVISSRNCYAQNPQQEWLRTWRFKPGAVWAAHEPPTLVEPLPNGEWRNVASVNPWLHEETEERGLVFQHFAYVIPEQLKFKEQYYGYTNALLQWIALQQQTKFPVLLRQYLGWVQDRTTVDTAESCGVVPIAQKASNTISWQFVEPDKLQSRNLKTKTLFPKIIIDGVFFQLFRTGIARVWQSLLEEWIKTDFAQHIILLDRGGTAPNIPGCQYRLIPPYRSDSGEGTSQREILEQICLEEGADLFISTYYTTPISTPSVFMAYDMVPEVMSWDLNRPLWQDKHHAIRSASRLIAISENTANDLVRFFPQISRNSVKVAYCGVDQIFSPANPQEIQDFKDKYRIAQPYFLLVGLRSGYKNAILFFKSLAKLENKDSFAIVCVGGGDELEDEFAPYVLAKNIYLLPHIEDNELRRAYAGAAALVYPSQYEGFGLPILEAMACGCPVITCAVASIPEVAGDAAIYVNDDVDEMAIALVNIQKPEVRESLIAAGFEQATKFSWSKMAKKVSSVLIEATLLPLKLRKNNFIIFPDWSYSEADIARELEPVIRTILAHPESQQITLLIDTSNLEEKSEIDANLVVAGVVMNLLMEEDLEMSGEPEISLVDKLGELQWQALLPRIQARISLVKENQEAIGRTLLLSSKSH